MNQENSDKDQLTTDRLFALALSNEDEEAYWECIQALQRKGGRDVLTEALRLATSESSKEREVGAYVLGQISGTSDVTKDAARALFRRLETEQASDVLSAVVVSIGHRGVHNSRVVKKLVALTSHASSSVRADVAFALGKFPGINTMNALVALSADDDSEVRNWATFALGSSPVWDYLDDPELRKALWSRVYDEDMETRAYALRGLAVRKDTRVIERLAKELEYNVVLDDVIEAAAELADSQLCPALLALREREGSNRFVLEEAIVACGCMTRD